MNSYNQPAWIPQVLQASAPVTSTLSPTTPSWDHTVLAHRSHCWSLNSPGQLYVIAWHCPLPLPGKLFLCAASFPQVFAHVSPSQWGLPGLPMCKAALFDLPFFPAFFLPIALIIFLILFLNCFHPLEQKLLEDRRIFLNCLLNYVFNCCLPSS